MGRYRMAGLEVRQLPFWNLSFCLHPFPSACVFQVFYMLLPVSTTHQPSLNFPPCLLRSASKNENSLGPGWCGSVDWVPACEPKGHQFDSQSGHMPGLQARCLVRGMWEVTSQLILLSSHLSSLSLPLLLKINKISKGKKPQQFRWQNCICL